jgi:hypothetical protein
MRCETCQKAQPTLVTRKRRVNEALFELGKSYHPFTPFDRIDAILVLNGFLDTDNATEGRADGLNYHTNVGEGLWLHVSAYLMPSGRFEVVAYLN